MERGEYCIGLDAGGSTLRIASGVPGRLSRVDSIDMASNLKTLGLERALSDLSAQITTFVAGARPPVAIALGIAGIAPQERTTVGDQLGAKLAHAGIRALVTVHSDAEIACANGGVGRTGTVVIAGTGAIACRINHGIESSSVDGNGWLLGDLGSGYWLGIEAARYAIRDLELRGESSPLLQTLISFYDLDRSRVRWSLIERFRELGVEKIAAFAREVMNLADSGDPRSLALVDTAANFLAESVLSNEPDFDLLILAGSILTNDTPVRRSVLALLEHQFRRIEFASSPVSGAVNLAWGSLGKAGSREETSGA